MIQISSLNMQETCTADRIDNSIANIGQAILSTHPTVLSTMSTAASFGQNMLFTLSYITYWSKIERRRQQQVD